MQKASELVPSGMLSVIGRPQDQYNYACLQAKEHCKSLGMENPVCSVANYLFPDGRVIAGHQQALDFLQENSRRLKFMRTKTLPVSGAFHTELMASATEPLREVLRQVESEGKSSLHHELKLKRRIQRENSQRERSGSARSSCSSRGSQSDDLTIHETEKTEKEKDKQDLEIENIIKHVFHRVFLLSPQPVAADGPILARRTSPNFFFNSLDTAIGLNCMSSSSLLNFKIILNSSPTVFFLTTLDPSSKLFSSKLRLLVCDPTKPASSLLLLPLPDLPPPATGVHSPKSISSSSSTRDAIPASHISVYANFHNP
ncbi:uncharacterized protein LOC112842970 [Oreochromis niloticus]|uniref:uncharacterized protein LOC112842970 n=1 Tax=Oreochromis niloticus TaxID=8128 RepID=UPI000DF351A7|nr:uncharacterized protein LOC112842970 [Oreochromis niloticus]